MHMEVKEKLLLRILRMWRTPLKRTEMSVLAIVPGAGLWGVPEMWEALLACPPACNCTTPLCLPRCWHSVCASCTWHTGETWTFRGTSSPGWKCVAPSEKYPPNWSPVLGCHISNSLARVFFPVISPGRSSQPFLTRSGAGKSHRVPNSSSWDWGGQTNDQLIACGFQGVLRLLCNQKLNLGYPYEATCSSCTGICCVTHEVRPHRYCDCCPPAALFYPLSLGQNNTIMGTKAAVFDDEKFFCSLDFEYIWTCCLQDVDRNELCI